jgi:hypothetical protein
VKAKIHCLLLLATIAGTVGICVPIPSAHGQQPSQGASAEKPQPTVKQKPSQPNLRQVMARAVESRMEFRGILDGGAPKLLNPKIGGPFQHTLPFGKPQTFYCVRVEIDQPLAAIVPAIRSASFTVAKLSDGREHLVTMRTNVIAGGPSECEYPKYEPFPELAKLRDMRRAAMGKK